jgi:hypothetical protein
MFLNYRRFFPQPYSGDSNSGQGYKARSMRPINNVEKVVLMQSFMSSVPLLPSADMNTDCIRNHPKYVPTLPSNPITLSIYRQRWLLSCPRRVIPLIPRSPRSRACVYSLTWLHLDLSLRILLILNKFQHNVDVIKSKVIHVTLNDNHVAIADCQGNVCER